MQYNQSIMVVFYFLIITMLLEGAENKTAFNLYEIKKIPLAGRPRQVIYSADDTIVVNCLEQCSSIDLKTENTTVFHKKSCSYDIKFLFFHDEKIFADTGGTMMIYDTKTNEKTWLKEKLHSAIITPHPDRPFLIGASGIAGKVVLYNYKTRETSYIVTEKDFNVMAVHPTDEIICVPSSARFYFYKLNDLSNPFKARIFGSMDDPARFCEYSLQGLIAAGNCSKINIVNSNEDKLSSCIEAEERELFICTKFHPDGIHLAILTQRYETNAYPVCIKIFNLETKKYVNPIKLGVGTGKDFSFSENGLKFVAVLGEECLRGLVPFAVEKESVNLLRWLHLLEEEEKISRDIVRYCFNVFLRAYVF